LQFVDLKSMPVREITSSRSRSSMRKPAQALDVLEQIGIDVAIFVATGSLLL